MEQAQEFKEEGQEKLCFWVFVGQIVLDVVLGVENLLADLALFVRHLVVFLNQPFRQKGGMCRHKGRCINFDALHCLLSTAEFSVSFCCLLLLGGGLRLCLVLLRLINGAAMRRLITGALSFKMVLKEVIDRLSTCVGTRNS